MFEYLEAFGLRDMLIGLLYLVFALFFAYISYKCFFEKFSIPKIILTVIISPVTGYLFFSINIIYDYYISETSGNASISTLIFYSTVHLFLQFFIYTIMVFLYVKLMKAKNASLPIFIYMCSLTLIPGVYYLINAYSYIPVLCYVFLYLLFYKMVVKQVAAISKTRQITDLRLFIILPVMTSIFNMVMYTVYTFTMQIVFSGELLDAVSDFKEKTGYTVAESMPVIATLIRYVTRSYAVFLFPSLFISTVLIIAFYVIIKNVKFTNELVKTKDEIKELSVEVMEALAHTIDAKDKYTRGHSVRVAKYSRMIAERMELSPEECENVYYMALLHDIGKIGVPNEVINSKSKLTDDEYAIIKTHPGVGYDILAEIKSRPDLSIGARWHHERFDGKGYPDGKSGEDIPLFARIISVADSYDAMTSNRSYRKYMPQDKVRSEIENNMGTQFDPDVAKCMLAIIDEDVDYELHE